MLWLETLPSFALWVGYVLSRRRWLWAARRRYASKTRRWRVVALMLALAGSLVALLLGVWATALAGWVNADGMSAEGFLAVTVIGLVFVHLQMIATAVTLSIGFDDETNSKSQRPILGKREPEPGDKQ